MKTILLCLLLIGPYDLTAQSQRRARPTPALSPSPTPTMSDTEVVGWTFALVALYGGLTLVGAFFYFIPTMVGWRKENFVALFALNFLLGWTCAGWVGALVWALLKDRPRRPQ